MKIEIEKDEYNRLLVSETKLTAEVSTANEQVTKLSADLKETSEKLEAAETKLKAAEGRVAEVEAAEKAMLEAEAEKYVSAAIKAGAILPKFKQKYVNDYLEASKKAEDLKLFKEDLEGRANVASFGEIKDGKKEGPVKYSAKDLESEEFSTDVGKVNELNDEIEARMQKNGTSFEEECQKLGLNADTPAPTQVRVAS